MADQPKSREDVYPFEWGGARDRGRVRERNEDVFVAQPELGLFLVLDGMGGHPAGDVAAEVMAAELPAAIEQDLPAMRSHRPGDICERLGQLIREQSTRLFLRGFSTPGREGMGATLALVLLLEGRACVANLGDSRVYRLRAGRLVQLSRDHSVIAELLAGGEIEPDDAAGHRARGLVTQHLGMPGRADPCVRSFALKPGDRFLLCSDGLTDMVKDTTLREILNGQSNCQDACDMLVQLANAQGGYDNITAVLVHWTG